MTDIKEGVFKLKKRTYFKDITAETELPESDLTFQDSESILQFSFKKEEDSTKVVISPGIYTLEERQRNALIPIKTELKERNLLTSIVNTKRIIEEATTFFSKLHIYEELGEPKARKILLHSAPGFGKTSTITHYAHHAIKEDPGTVVLIWPTSEIGSDAVKNFLSLKSEYEDKCTRMILIMEDIGGGEKENHGGARGVDSGLLELLDGLQMSFKLPTFIIATTNYPQNLLSALADRPGRFDLIMPLKNLSYEEKIALVAFIAKRELSEEEKLVFKNKAIEGFSVAHLKEVVIRSKIHDKSLGDVVKELIEHKKNFNKAFEDKEGLGFRD